MGTEVRWVSLPTHYNVFQLYGFPVKEPLTAVSALFKFLSFWDILCYVKNIFKYVILQDPNMFYNNLSFDFKYLMIELSHLYFNIEMYTLSLVYRNKE